VGDDGEIADVIHAFLCCARSVDTATVSLLRKR